MSIQGILYILSAVAAVIAVVRVIRLPYDQGLGVHTLYYLLAAGVLLLLRDVEKLKILDTELILRKAEKVENLAEVTRKKVDLLTEVSSVAISDAPKREGAPRPPTPKSTTRTRPAGPAPSLRPDTRADDPQKGRWGGKAVDKFRELAAGEIRPLQTNAAFYNVPLEVRSTDPVNHPLTGKVTFHLHDTFHPNAREVEAVHNVARLSLVAYGAFTVGAETADGARLELDLSGPSIDAPREFKES